MVEDRTSRATQLCMARRCIETRHGASESSEVAMRRAAEVFRDELDEGTSYLTVVLYILRGLSVPAADIDNV